METMTVRRFKDLLSILEANAELVAYGFRDGDSAEYIREHTQRKEAAYDALVRWVESREIA